MTTPSFLVSCWDLFCIHHQYFFTSLHLNSLHCRHQHFNLALDYYFNFHQTSSQDLQIKIHPLIHAFQADFDSNCCYNPLNLGWNGLSESEFVVKIDYLGQIELMVFVKADLN
jgi:hypothetical protein